jgi:hypothetical protein
MVLSKGTRSLLFGAHQFVIHPLILAYSWYKLFGFPLDIRLWFCFFLHDVGYLGKINMDGLSGKTHPELGAKIITFLFGEKWGKFCKYHSRDIAKRDKKQISKLCLADKMAIYYTPICMYNKDELCEYIKNWNDEILTCKDAIKVKHDWKEWIDKFVIDFYQKNRNTAYGPSDY